MADQEGRLKPRKVNDWVEGKKKERDAKRKRRKAWINRRWNLKVKADSGRRTRMVTQNE